MKKILSTVVLALMFLGFERTYAFNHVKTVISNQDFTVMAQFPGGKDSLQAYLDKNLGEAIKIAKSKLVHGQVLVKFTVDTAGVISNPVVMKGIDPEVHDAVIRMIKNMPLWDPCIIKGRKVVSSVVLPITFNYPE
ncbi:MAG: energy transducer TonB [Cytophagaceae bacterium]